MYAVRFSFATIAATIVAMTGVSQAELVNSVADIGNQLQKQPAGLPQNPFALPYYSYQAMLQAAYQQNNNLQQAKVQEQQKPAHEVIDLGEILGQKTAQMQQQPQPQQQQQFPSPVLAVPPMSPPLTHFHHLPPSLPLAAPLPPTRQ